MSRLERRLERRLGRWHWRPWFGALGGVLALVVLLPPVGAEARRYVFAQAVQFAVLATAVPALVVLGAPWRLGGRVAAKGRVADEGGVADGGGGTARPGGEPVAVTMRLVDRVAVARSHRRPSAVRCAVILLGFLALAIFWRLPLAVNALVTKPVLTVVEAITLLAVGVALWLELVESPPLLPRMNRPLRAAFAAVPMWTIWATAYIMGFSHATWFTALGHRPRNGLGVVADQEIAAVVLWAIPGLFFIPVVYFSLIMWLRDTADPDDELKSAPAPGGDGHPGPPRPPRGWRLPPA
ncbi:MAG TPA: cytochrome c oxidase assembly protein [Streptosporangiaceae bacterium]|nr:cytochrome c oxidase assembly protein [Streptosporangiaceae bacterium]